MVYFYARKNEQWRSARQWLSGIYAVDGNEPFNGVWQIELSSSRFYSLDCSDIFVNVTIQFSLSLYREEECSEQ